MNIFENIKIKVKTGEQERISPFAVWRVSQIPSPGSIKIIIHTNIEDAVNDMLTRIFSTADISITADILEQIQYAEKEKDVLTLLYRGETLGIIYIEEDMFSKILNFKPHL